MSTHRLLAALCAMVFASTFSIGAFPALLPEIGRDAGLEDWQLGTLAGAYGLALAMRIDPSDAMLEKAYSVINETRPTAINLKWALDRVRNALHNKPAGERAEHPRKRRAIDARGHRKLGGLQPGGRALDGARVHQRGYAEHRRQTGHHQAHGDERREVF